MGFTVPGLQAKIGPNRRRWATLDAVTGVQPAVRLVLVAGAGCAFPYRRAAGPTARAFESCDERRRAEPAGARPGPQPPATARTGASETACRRYRYCSKPGAGTASISSPSSSTPPPWSRASWGCSSACRWRPGSSSARSRSTCRTRVSRSMRFQEMFWKTGRLDDIWRATEASKPSPVSEVFRAGYTELAKLQRRRQEQAATRRRRTSTSSATSRAWSARWRAPAPPPSPRWRAACRCSAPPPAPGPSSACSARCGAS